MIDLSDSQMIYRLQPLLKNYFLIEKGVNRTRNLFHLKRMVLEQFLKAEGDQYDNCLKIFQIRGKFVIKSF